MKKLFNLLCITLAMITAFCIASAAVTLYAPDGRTIDKPESEVDLYTSLGWYEYPVTKMYSLDGRTIICATANVEANKKVGWFTEPMAVMYSLDGRTLICKKANVEANKKVGWYTEPMAVMYSLDGRTLVCKKTNVEANKKVGWYTEPMTIMYSLDGRTFICKKANVEANKKVGWYTEPMTIMYSLDGRTLVCPKANVEANKKVGWYTEPPIIDIDYLYGYGDTLDRYMEIILAYDEYFEEEVWEWGVMEHAHASGYMAQFEIGYIIKDFSGDGIPELLIGSSGSNEIYAAFTLVNGKPECTLAGWSRSRYHLNSDGTIYHEGSSGAAYNCYGLYEFAYNGTIKCKSFIFTEPDEDSYTWETNYYYNTTGNWDVYESKQISSDYFWSVQKNMPQSGGAIDYILFTRYLDHYYLDFYEVEFWYADDIINAFPTCYRFVAQDDYAEEILFVANEVVTDFTIYRISNERITGYAETTFDTTPIYKLGTLTPGKPLLAKIPFMDTPIIGISYIDANGQIHYWALGESGMCRAMERIPFTK